MKIFHSLPVKSLPQRIGRSVGALLHLLYFKPAYLFLAGIVSVVFYEIIFWSLNIGLLQHLLTTEFLTPTDKLGVVAGSYSGLLTPPFDPLTLTLFIVSILQGAAVAAIVYTIKKERATGRRMAKELGGTGVAGVMSILGLGCVPCGTSLITPILTFFFATSSVAIAQQVGFYSAVLAFVISLVTAYLAGSKLAQKL